jgi:hypothetical protein
MTTIIEDLRGVVVGVGDTIAYAAHDGRSTGMRVGKIVEIVEASRRPFRFQGELKGYTDVPTKIRVAIEHSNREDSSHPAVLIHADMKRFVKVSP